jgi:hypothetical protein
LHVLVALLFLRLRARVASSVPSRHARNTRQPCTTNTAIELDRCRESWYNQGIDNRRTRKCRSSLTPS